VTVAYKETIMKNNQTAINLDVSTTKGVGYYNINNIDKKNKKDKTLNEENPFSSSSFGQSALHASNSQLLGCQQEEELLDSKAEPVAPPALSKDDIMRCIFQLFDNGEGSSQRYKFKIRLNLADKSNPEFIANMTKDFRNFKKYIPEPYRNEIIEMARQERISIKDKTGFYPYLGKLHMNKSKASNRVRNQIEPDTLVVIWFDEEERGWSGLIKIQNWVHEFDLFSQHLTQKQKDSKVKCQDVWINPKHDKTVRPLTWAQQTGRSK